MTAHLSTLDMTDGGGDHDPGDGNRRLLSVAELQQALRELHARRPRSSPTETGAPSESPQSGNSQRTAFESKRVPTARRPRRASASTPAEAWGDIEGEGPARRGDIAAGTREHGPHSGELKNGWVAVVAAHAGAGASTVALVLSDAAAADGLRVHLVDTAHPFRSGLVAAASEELGTDVTGVWRRGLRTGVTVDRRATDTAFEGWPVPPVGDSAPLTVVDLGLADPETLTRLAADRIRPIVVCRPTVPGVRLTEQLLEQLPRQPVVVAAVGPSRWPGEVTTSLGPRLRALRAAGRVVPLPMDRRLEVAGLTSSPPPRPLRSAGRLLLELLELLDGSPRGAATPLSPRNTRPVSTPKESRR